MSSRFLNVSPRVYIRQKDSVNILPRIPRTGYQNELGIEESKFDDTETIIFADGCVVLSPYMITSSLAAESGFYTGSLLLTASVRDRSSYIDKNVENDPLFPFKERFKSISETDFDIGFPQDQYPGFSSPESDKVALVFDMSSPNSFTLTKLKLDDSLRDASGPLYNQRASGFAYYNHSNKSWNDVGIEDRASTGVIDYDPILKLDNADLPIRYQLQSGDEQFVSQFSSSPNSIITEKFYDPSSITDLEARGYHKIGEPTNFFGAPHSPRYHAKQGQSVKLSDYITAPFVVDRIIAKLPVVAHRSQDPKLQSDPFVRGFARDIDNYVFFIYVQNRSHASVDSTNDVSSSIRYLIGKESFCFSNQETLNDVYQGQKPIHDVTQSFFLTMGSTEVNTLTLDTDVYLNFRPRVFNQAFGTISKIPARGLDQAGPFEITGSIFVKNFWRGGQYASGSINEPLYVANTANLNSRKQSLNAIEEFVYPSPRSFVSSYWEGTTRTVQTGSGLRYNGANISTVSLIDSSKETPVVLFPDDELVFALESGVNAIMPNPALVARNNSACDSDVLSVTGSRLQIKAGTGYVILYGSMIKEGVESLPSLNQYLGSDAVSEDIHEDGPYDEFDIYNKSILSASYVDNFITGSIFDGTRRRERFRSSMTLSISGTIERNVRFIDNQRLFYDTFVPPITVISGGLAEASIVNPATLRVDQASGGFYPFDNKRTPFLKRSFVYESFSGSPRIKDFNLDLYLYAPGPSYALDESLSGDDAKFALFYNGNFNSKTATTKNYQGAASLRYGLMSPRLVGPSYVYRRDRYGQVRDMLEQARDSKTVTTIDGKDTLSKSVVYATFVSSSSDSVISAELTQCSNLSFECTSSVPYTDNVARNRGNVPSFTVSFGPNNLIFGITGSFGYQ